MNCHEARETLTHDYPSEMRRADRNAQEHVLSCPACQTHFRAVRRLCIRLGGLETEKPSPEFKERLLAALAEARLQQASDSRSNRAKSYAAVLVIALCLAIGWIWLGTRIDDSRLADYLISDHQEILPDRLMVESSSPSDIERWFDGKVDFPVRVRELAGAQVQGARLCSVFGSRAALVFYRSGSHVISWFTFPQNGDHRAKPQLQTIRGYSVYVWNEEGLTNALVSDLNAAVLAAMPRLDE